MSAILIPRGRDQMPGGYSSKYLDRSRSRDEYTARGEEYGRKVDKDVKRDRSLEKDAKIIGKDDTPANAGSEKEGMHRGGGGGY